MAEKRKPSLVVVLKKRSKKEPSKWLTFKVELFPVRLWPEARIRGDKTSLFRLRIRGKWWGKGKFDTVTITDFSKMFRVAMGDAYFSHRQKKPQQQENK